MAAIIMDFGKNNEGVNLYRINGSKEEIEKAIADLKSIGCELWDEPYQLEKSHKHWSVLVRFQVPENEQSEEKDEAAAN
jgi:hypothetical protein